MAAVAGNMYLPAAPQQVLQEKTVEKLKENTVKNKPLGTANHQKSSMRIVPASPQPLSIKQSSSTNSLIPSAPMKENKDYKLREKNASRLLEGDEQDEAEIVQY